LFWGASRPVGTLGACEIGKKKVFEIEVAVESSRVLLNKPIIYLHGHSAHEK